MQLAAMLVCGVSLTVIYCAAEFITIDNTKPRLAVDGTIVNSHDGTVRFVDGEWWLHAASYGTDPSTGALCDDPPRTGCQKAGGYGGCGFHRNHNVSMYSSPNMSSGSWTYRGDALRCAELPDCGILYRPHMVWNPTTKLFVLFYNYVSASGIGSRIGAATSVHPAGPYTLRTAAMRFARPQLPSNHNGSQGDFDVLVDTDGTGYIVYSYGPMSIEQLAPDFLSSAMINATFPGGDFNNTVAQGTFMEAPSLWRHSETGRYFLTTGHCCCFCWQGSGMIVFSAPRPLGPWHRQPGAADLGCIANASNPTPAEQGTLPLTATISAGQGCNYQGAVAASTSRAQQNFVVPIVTVAGSTEYVWTGDRWMQVWPSCIHSQSVVLARFDLPSQAPDGKKAHEPQFWGKLSFDATGKLLPLRWVDQLTIDMALPQPSG